MGREMEIHLPPGYFNKISCTLERLAVKSDQPVWDVLWDGLRLLDIKIKGRENNIKIKRENKLAADLKLLYQVRSDFVKLSGEKMATVSRLRLDAFLHNLALDIEVLERE